MSLKYRCGEKIHVRSAEVSTYKPVANPMTANNGWH